jgi:hypothetical protein
MHFNHVMEFLRQSKEEGIEVLVGGEKHGTCIFKCYLDRLNELNGDTRLN